MLNNNNNFKEKIKKLKPKGFIYPAVSAVFFAAILWTFISAAGFISKAINKIFTAGSEGAVESQIVKVDLDNYYLVAKKLGLNTEPPNEETPPVETPAVETQQITTTTEPIVPPQEEIIDKSAVKIQILNSSGVKGLAAELKTLFSDNGFTAVETGNQSKAEETTLLKIKAAKQNSRLAEELKNIVASKYSSVETQTLDEQSAFDAVVIIGKK